MNFLKKLTILNLLALIQTSSSIAHENYDIAEFSCKKNHTVLSVLLKSPKRPPLDSSPFAKKYMGEIQAFEDQKIVYSSPLLHSFHTTATRCGLLFSISGFTPSGDNYHIDFEKVIHCRFYDRIHDTLELAAFPDFQCRLTHFHAGI